MFNAFDPRAFYPSQRVTGVISGRAGTVREVTALSLTVEYDDTKERVTTCRSAWSPVSNSPEKLSVVAGDQLVGQIQEWSLSTFDRSKVPVYELKSPDPALVAPIEPTHRCKVCGALWRLWSRTIQPPEGGWSLVSAACGPCCDNVPMRDQIEEIVADPVAVLVVPPPEASLRIGKAAHPLLAGHEVLGGEPPMVWCKGGEWQAPWDPYDTDGPMAIWPEERALPLWWDGQLVPEGCDRVSRMLLPPSFREDCRGVIERGAELVARGFASRMVLLDRVNGILVART